MHLITRSNISNISDGRRKGNTNNCLQILRLLWFSRASVFPMVFHFQIWISVHSKSVSNRERILVSCNVNNRSWHEIFLWNFVTVSHLVSSRIIHWKLRKRIGKIQHIRSILILFLYTNWHAEFYSSHSINTLCKVSWRLLLLGRRQSLLKEAGIPAWNILTASGMQR